MSGAGEIAGLVLAAVALLPMVKAAIDTCGSIRDAPKEMTAFRRDLEVYYQILNSIKAAADDILSRPKHDQPKLASIVHKVHEAMSECETTASELQVMLDRTKGRFSAYFKQGKMLRLHQRLMRRTVTLQVVLQALDRVDRDYPSEKVVNRHKDIFDIHHDPHEDPPPRYTPSQQNGINWGRVGKIAIWTILGAAALTAAVYAVPFLIAYFTGAAVTTGLGVCAVPAATLPWTAASCVSYATTLACAGSTSAATAAGTAVAAAATASTFSGVTIAAAGVTVMAQSVVVVASSALGGIMGAIWGASQ